MDNIVINRDHGPDFQTFYESTYLTRKFEAPILHSYRIFQISKFF